MGWDCRMTASSLGNRKPQGALLAGLFSENHLVSLAKVLPAS